MTDTAYKYCVKFPIPSTVQGSTNFPTIWTFIFFTLFEYHSQRAYTMSISNPSEDTNAYFNMIGFVDNYTIITSIDDNDTI